MKHMHVVLGVVVSVAFATAAGGQVLPPTRHLVGQSISEQLQLDPRTGSTTETVTLTFRANDSGPVFAVDFITRHLAQRPIPAPSAVDIVVTQQPVEDDTPEMTIQADGQSLPLVARLHSRRSVAATVSMSEFIRLANAETLIEQTLDSELEFSPGQVKMLRMIADRWLGRLQP